MLGVFFVIPIDASIQRLLHGNGRALRRIDCIIKHLSAPYSGSGKAVLMDTDKTALPCFVDQLYPVIQVRDFLFPKRLRASTR